MGELACTGAVQHDDEDGGEGGEDEEEFGEPPECEAPVGAGEGCE